MDKGRISEGCPAFAWRTEYAVFFLAAPSAQQEELYDTALKEKPCFFCFLWYNTSVMKTIVVGGLL